MRKAFLSIVSVMICCTLSHQGAAITQEYQIRRLIYLSTACGIETYSIIDEKPGHEVFKVTCKNVSSYPDGIEIVCSDPDDDRSCKVTTEASHFDQLELMRPREYSEP